MTTALRGSGSLRSAAASRRRGWHAPSALVSLSVLPLVAGAARLVQLSGGPELMPADSRFTASPLPVVVHIVSAAVFALLGALQFAAGFRRRRPGWHRAAGRVAVVAGLGVALSALCLTLFFPSQPGSGPLLFVLRLVFGSAMVASMGLGVGAIRRGDVATHRAWMTRAYAIALAAGTQVFTEGIGRALLGHGPLALDVSRGAAWVVNLAVAEWVIRRRPVAGAGVGGGSDAGSGGGLHRHQRVAFVVGERS